MKNWREIINDYMIEDEYFCMCGCSPWWWNVKRIIITTIKKFKNVQSKQNGKKPN